MMKRKSLEEESLSGKDLLFNDVFVHVLNIRKEGGAPEWTKLKHVDGKVIVRFSRLQNTLRLFPSKSATTATHEFKVSQVKSHVLSSDRFHQVGLEHSGKTIVFSFQFESEEDSKAFGDLIVKNNDRLVRDMDPSCSRDYFSNYSKLVNQQHMLQDTHRTGTYYAAVMQNASDFKDKVVMDVGAGTAILSFFSAQAGARKVYAVEASDMATFAKRLVETNDYDNVIEVKHTTVEDLTLDSMVDTLISEPMGTLLINERMIETYVAARDKFLRPGGKMFPSKGTVFVAPISDMGLHNEYCQYGAFFQQDNFYGLDMRALQDDSLAQQFCKPAVDYFDPNSLLAEPVSWECDFTKTTIEELQKIEIPLMFMSTKVAIVHGLGCWFDVDFIGSTCTVNLSTGPSDPPTHWRQMRLIFRTPLAVNPGQKLTGMLSMKTNEFHSYDIDLRLTLDGTNISTSSTDIDLRYPAYGPFAGSVYIPPPAMPVPVQNTNGEHFEQGPIGDQQ